MKENDIRPEELMTKKKPAIENDKNFLRNCMVNFVEVPCPACLGKDYVLWGEKEGFTYAKCNFCQTVYMNPRASEDILRTFYKNSQNYKFWNKYIFPSSEKTRKEKIFKPRADKVINYCKKNGVKGGTLLEIGSAFGTFCETIREHDFFNRIIAVEPSAELAETCRKKGLEVIEQVVETLSIPQNSIDVIVSFEVVEHLFNPRCFFEQSVGFLKGNGLFLCSCPNGKGFDSLVFKEKARCVDHEHINYFNPFSLRYLMKECGLDVLEISTPGELDMDIFSNLFEEYSNLVDNDFFKYLAYNGSKEIKKEFQNFLKNNLLSSHMWGVARKSCIQ